MASELNFYLINAKTWDNTLRFNENNALDLNSFQLRSYA
jgi:hypothetical protein